MWSLIRGDPDSVVAFAPYVLIGGMALAWLSRFGDGIGILGAFSMISLGAAGASLEHWRSERGLWMLAGLFLFVFGPIYVGVCVGHVLDAWNGAAPLEAALLVEVSLATVLLGSQVRFLMRVAKENLAISHPAWKE